MPGSERLRRRPAVSCTFCRKRKVRCDQKSPCATCVRARNGHCVYTDRSAPSVPQNRGQGQAADLRPKPQNSTNLSSLPTHQITSNVKRLSGLGPSSLSGSTNVSSPISQVSSQEIDWMKNRIRELEDQLSKAAKTVAQVPISEQSTDRQAETTKPYTAEIPVHENHISLDEPNARHIAYKTRLFGRSHWMNGMVQFQDTFEIIGPYLRKEMLNADSGLQRSKSLAKFIKLQRSPPWSSTKTVDLPLKYVADKLVDCYLRTDTIYHVLHTPTFKKGYDELWLSDTTKPDTAFMVQVKLVLAIGATIYDDEFSLRPSAIQWVHEAHTWLSEPTFKSRLNIESLQTSILYLIARETVSVGGELTWISAGSLLRTAVFMGLHQEPVRPSNLTTFDIEMRRRLWNAVLEITVQTSMDSGGPPFLSLDDFNTLPPGNFDDNQLMTNGAVPKPDDDLTQISITLAFRKTFPIRLAIIKFLNNISSSGSYEETLRLDTELRASYKVLRQTLQACKTTGEPLSQFETHMINIIMCRYLLALHIPFFNLSLQNATYAFSRKVVVETALKIWDAVNPSSSIMAASSLMDRSSPDQDLIRLTTCSSGFFRTAAFQASFVIAAELRAQLLEDTSLGSTHLRSDQLSVLEDAKTLMLLCIEAGETNIKNYLVICVISAQIEGLMHRLPTDKISHIKAVEDAVTQCLSILEAKATQCEDYALDMDGTNPISLNSPVDFMGDWDFLTSDQQFEFNSLVLSELGNDT